MSDKPDLSIVPGQPDAKPEAEKSAVLTEARKKFDALVGKKAEKTQEKSREPEEVLMDEGELPKTAKADDSEKAPEGADDEPEVEQPSQAEKLRAKLLLAGNPKKVVETLDDKEVVEMWQKQEKREKDAASALQRASVLEKKLAELEAKATSKPSEPQAGVPTEELDLDEVSAQLADQFGEDESKALVSALKTVIEPLKRRSDELSSIIDSARKLGVANIERSNRARLAEKMPSLKENEDAWRVIHETVQGKFSKDPGAFSSAEDGYDSVFNTLYGDILKQQAEGQAAREAAEMTRKQRETSRIAASTISKPNAQRSERPTTPLDAHRAAFRVLWKNNEDVEGAAKQFGRLVQ